jgi:hypothetical protein
VTLFTPDAGRKAVAVIPSVDHPERFNATIAINASEKDPTSLVYEIALDPEQSLTGTVVGPDGKPLTEVLAWGLAPAFDTRYDGDLLVQTLRASAFMAQGLDDRNPRYVLFWHKEKGLAKAVLLWGDERGPLIVRLEPLGTATGRLVDQDGKPLAEVGVFARFRDDPNSHVNRLFVCGLHVFSNDVFETLFFVDEKTDAEGGFRVPRLVPGLLYGFSTDGGKSGQFFRNFVKDMPAPIRGETRDLGTITLTVKKPEIKKP